MIQDVELLLSTHGIKFKNKGSKVLCLCPNPDHQDTSIGSFSFDKLKGVGHCFACGYSCNIFSLNKLLGEKGGYNKNYNSAFTKSLKPKQKEEITYPKPIIYGKLYNPFTSNEVMDFLHSIGWSDEFIEEKEVKYCRYCEMISEDLINDPDEDNTVMSNRIVIPIYRNGQLINYECRSFDGNPIKVKYVNGCRVNYIYNYENIDLSKEVVLTESMKNLGKGWNVTKNIISSFGNQLTDIKLEMLNKIPNLTVFADYDDGGKTMLQKLKDNYEGNLRVTFNPKRYRDKDGELKGKDMNDCSIKEIEFYLNNTMSVDKAIQRLSFDDEADKIFWT